jgi:hypothetical protein
MMKTHRLYALAAVNDRGVSLYSKMIFALVIIALMFAFLPAASVFAAPASNQDSPETDRMELEWKNKLRNLRVLGSFYDRVRLVPADFKDPDDLDRVRYYLDKYGFALRQANTVVLNHTGFDSKGNVTNQIQATDTLHELGQYLHMMRGLKTKMDAVDGDVSVARR